MNHMVDKTAEIVKAMKETILHRNGDPMPAAEERENNLNRLRYQIREAHVNRIRDGMCDPYAGIIFTDMLTSFEKMGDHAFNVIEATVGLK